MIAVSPVLFEKLVRKRLLPEVDRILGIGRQGFDIHIHCNEPLLRDAFERLFIQTARDLTQTVHLVRGFVEFEALRQTQMSAKRYEPIVLIGGEDEIEGAGLLSCLLPDLIDILPAAPATIRIILTHHGLEVYQAVFSAERVGALKPLLEKGHLSAFIDAVVQVAYFEGACADGERADCFVRSLSLPVAREPSLHVDAITLDRVLQWLLDRGPTPLVHAKSLLSYYVVHVKQCTHVQASQVLGISRTTLQMHLRLAEKCRAGDAFGALRKGPVEGARKLTSAL